MHFILFLFLIISPSHDCCAQNPQFSFLFHLITSVSFPHSSYLSHTHIFTHLRCPRWSQRCHHHQHCRRSIFLEKNKILSPRYTKTIHLPFWKGCVSVDGCVQGTFLSLLSVHSIDFYVDTSEMMRKWKKVLNPKIFISRVSIQKFSLYLRLFGLIVLVFFF